MPIKVKDVATSSKKFTLRGAAAAADYQAGVLAAGQDWQTNTAASAENFAAGVGEAITRGAFAKGVAKAGGAKYAQKAGTVGARRFPEGVRGGRPGFRSRGGALLADHRGDNPATAQAQGGSGELRAGPGNRRGVAAPEVGRLSEPRT